jgi:hypothetical protein
VKQTTEVKGLWGRVAITAAALGLFVAQLLWPGARLEATSLGLLALAVIPWLSSILESAKLPGGWELVP